MGEFIPAFHKRIRSEFPVNASGVVQEVQFGGTAPKMSVKERWEFLTRDRRSGVLIDDGFLVLQTTSYQDFESFRSLLFSLVTALNEVAGTLLIQRVGLRYVDAIVPKPGDSWKQYVKEELRGFDSSVFGEEGALRLHQTVAQTSVGTILVRLYQNLEGAVLPPDLAGGQMKPSILAEHGQLVTLLDIDHFHVCADGVELAEMDLESTLWKLKTDAFTIFHKHLVTEYALGVWA